MGQPQGGALALMAAAPEQIEIEAARAPGLQPLPAEGRLQALQGQQQWQRISPARPCGDPSPPGPLASSTALR